VPADKPVEARRQTTHKLETMDRYWRIWCRILAQATAFPFCTRHLWLVDTMAGTGIHESISDRGGRVPGTPFQAVLAARATQAEFLEVTVHVRAIDKKKDYVAELDKLFDRYRLQTPSVDAQTYPNDWVEVVPGISAEIAGKADHPFRASIYGHQHRSLWLIDPFGLEPLRYDVIDALPRWSEVIVNFDGNAARRHAAKNLSLLEHVYRDDRWRQATDAEGYAQAFMDQFPRFTIRNLYPLWPSGSQDRFLIHLTTSKAAIRPFRSSVTNGLKAGTIAAGDLLNTPQKHAAALSLQERFAGLELAVDEMYAAGAGFTKQQLRLVCQVADELGCGKWLAKALRMTWFIECEPDPTFGL
jgi:three-Cys-motif partner protein